MIAAAVLLVSSIQSAQTSSAARGPDADLLQAIACAPAVLPAAPVTAARVIGGIEDGQMMFGPGDHLLVNAGSRDGLHPGQQFFVKRTLQQHPYALTDAGFRLVGIHTSGWITIEDTREHVSTAIVTHACDGVLDGDYLEPFTEPALPPPPSPAGTPDYSRPAHILMADEQRQTGFPGMLMLIDRGSQQGVRPGQTLTIFRTAAGGAGPAVDVGRATVLQAGPATALVRIDASIGAVYVGDLTALPRSQQ
ncbi:MAG: hypothetical protein ACRD1V_21715 [Vicinamibacterales bacterium]